MSACRTHGYGREELIGKMIADIISPEDVPRLSTTRPRAGFCFRRDPSREDERRSQAALGRTVSSRVEARA